MAIDTECKKCGETYRVKDELAGKKIRCKACSTVMLVPQLDEDEWDEEVPEEELPPVRKSSKKAKRKPSSDGMPISIMLAAICVVAMLATTGYQLLQMVEVINQLQAMLNKPRAIRNDYGNLPARFGSAVGVDWSSARDRIDANHFHRARFTGVTNRTFDRQSEYGLPGHGLDRHHLAFRVHCVDVDAVIS